MCYRFHLKVGDLRTAAKKLGLAVEREMADRHNIAPGVPIAGIRQDRHSGARDLALLRWGLLPAWSKSPTTPGTSMANARAETITEKDSFREPFLHRRCIIPASGFFEWEAAPSGGRQPWLFSRADGAPLLLAGLWERWSRPGFEPIESCTIITTTPNSLLGEIHDRMPVILPDEACETWLEAEPHEAAPLLAPLPSELLLARKVDPWVNDVRHDDERCLRSYAPAAGEQMGLF